MDILISTNWRRENYDINFVIVNYLTMIVYYESVKTIIDLISLAKVNINMVIKYHHFFKLIINISSSLFTLKF